MRRRNIWSSTVGSSLFCFAACFSLFPCLPPLALLRCFSRRCFFYFVLLILVRFVRISSACGVGCLGKRGGVKKNKPSKELRGEHEPKTAPKSKTSIERTRKIVEAVQAESLGSTVGTSEVQSVPKCIQTGPSRSVLQHQLVCQMHKRFQSLLQ